MQRDEHLPQRVLDYNYLIHKKYRRPVASLVLLADAAQGWRPAVYVETLLVCTLVLQYALAKLTDFAAAVDKLSAIHSPFALLTAAHVLTQQTHGKPDQRFAAKWRLVKRLFDLGWGKRRIMDLFAVINWPSSAGAARLLEEQLTAKFGALSPTVRKRLTKAGLPQLLAWSAALLEARSMRQVFARPPSD